MPKAMFLESHEIAFKMKDAMTAMGSSIQVINQVSAAMDVLKIDD